jgi:hypothetical protein
MSEEFHVCRGITHDDFYIKNNMFYCSICHGRCEHRLSNEEIEQAYLEEEIRESGEIPIDFERLINEIMQVILEYEVNLSKYPTLKQLSDRHSK